jgi:chromosome partitioning protein
MSVFHVKRRMLDLNSTESEDGAVTDPDELRNRAASIFERLRTSGGSSAEPASPPTPSPSGVAASPREVEDGGAPDDDDEEAAQAPAVRASAVAAAEGRDQRQAARASANDSSEAPETPDGGPSPLPSPPESGPGVSPCDPDADPRTGPVDDVAVLGQDGSGAVDRVETTVDAPADPADGRVDRSSGGADGVAADLGASPLPGTDALRAWDPTGAPERLDEAPVRPDDRSAHSARRDQAGVDLADLAGDVGPSRRPLPRILAIANQKGGVGKTTTAVNLGASLAELGFRVLVVDLDPQGNATTGLGINARNLDASVYDVILHDVPIEDCVEPTSLRNLFVVPATIDLAGAEIELVPVFSRELRLRRALEHLGDDFDFTLIDCPPSLGLLTVNGLAAANEVVVPIQCEYYALEGLGQLLRNVNLVRTNLNPSLEVSTIILTMYDARTRLAEQVVAEVRKHFGDRVCRSVVPRTVRLSEAPSFGQPIIVFDSSSRGAIAYRELAKEVSGGSPQRVG